MKNFATCYSVAEHGLSTMTLTTARTSGGRVGRLRVSGGRVGRLRVYLLVGEHHYVPSEILLVINDSITSAPRILFQFC